MDLETKIKKKVISATILLSGGDLLTGEEAKNYIAEALSSQLKEVLKRLPEEARIDKNFITQSDFETGYNQCLDEVKGVLAEVEKLV